MLDKDYKWDQIKGVTTEFSGNVYVVGGTEGGLDRNSSAGSDDLIFIKYNSDGNKK